MTILNDTAKTCVVQTFADTGNSSELFATIDCKVRDYINDMQRDYWFIQNIQHTIVRNPGSDYITYMVHLVMSRMWDSGA